MTRMGRRAAFAIVAGFVFAAVAPANAEPTSSESSSALQTQRVGKPMSLIRPAATKKAAKSRARVKFAARGRKPAKVAAQSRQRKIVSAKVKIDQPAVASIALPPQVANARAQLAEPAQTPAAATAPSAPLEIAAADQMNELDRALSEPSAKVEKEEPALTEIAAATPAPAVAQSPAPSPTVYAQASNNPPRDESTLIGKIFIAFGGLLTLASAARMLIA